jgi:hypothetical protein
MWLLHRALGCGRLFIGRHIRGAVCKTVGFSKRAFGRLQAWPTAESGRDVE